MDAGGEGVARADRAGQADGLQGAKISRHCGGGPERCPFLPSGDGYSAHCAIRPFFRRTRRTNSN